MFKFSFKSLKISNADTLVIHQGYQMQQLFQKSVKPFPPTRQFQLEKKSPKCADRFTLQNEASTICKIRGMTHFVLLPTRFPRTNEKRVWALSFIWSLSSSLTIIFPFFTTLICPRFNKIQMKKKDFGNIRLARNWSFSTVILTLTSYI